MESELERKEKLLKAAGRALDIWADRCDVLKEACLWALQNGALTLDEGTLDKLRRAIAYASRSDAK